MNNTFGERLKILLDTGGHKYNRPVSQSELSKELGITRQAISSYLNEATLPTIDKLKIIADFFDVSYDYLMGDSYSQKRENYDISNRLGLSDETVNKVEALKAASDNYESRNNSGEYSELNLLNKFLCGCCDNGVFIAMMSLCRLYKNSMTDGAITFFDVEESLLSEGSETGAFKDLFNAQCQASKYGCRIIGAKEDIEYNEFKLSERINKALADTIGNLKEASRKICEGGVNADD